MTPRVQSAPRGARTVSVLSATLLAATVTGCSSADNASDDAAGSLGSAGSTVPTLTADVTAEHPFDPSSFTQGLEVMPEGDLLVSTGLNGESRIYRAPVDDAASPTVSDGLDERYFGEGATRHGDTVWQLTWKSGVAFARDADTLEITDEASYDGEGWGLCSDGERLVMSDGSPTLTFRDPGTFAATGTVEVTLDGEPVEEINELECTGSGDDRTVWANVWHTDDILRIDPSTGEVTGVAELDLPAGDQDGADVLNGIAASGADDSFFVTGKLWDTLYEVTFREE
ncbi:glutaminyl-peptide cyclotransferase [Corynebacterium sp.]|uniref:glutaminyl-peptide cyclotransferase n=1 Tax=Corynebacterium sp. TaxID=1720 RepID=UPI003B3A08B0